MKQETAHNKQQTTKSKQQPTTNHQRQPTNHQQPTTNNQLKHNTSKDARTHIKTRNTQQTTTKQTTQ